MSLDNLHYYIPNTEKTNTLIKKDLVVYGGTPAGITAAIQAKKMGLTVIVAEFGDTIGGMTASGLGATDLGVEDAIGGLSKTFYQEIAKYYGKEKQYTFEPKAAKAVFDKWIKEYEIDVYYRQHLTDVKKKNGKIIEIVMEDGTRYQGNIYTDSTYEGDLLARADVSYCVGRESNASYQEIYNGIQFGAPHHKFDKWIDPYVVEGDPKSGLLEGINEDNPKLLGYQGKGDHRIQAYNFRVCLTKDEKNKITFPKPKHYRAERYELLLRYIHAGVWDAMNLHTMLPNGKTDLNNYGAFSSDHIGANFDWPDGSYERREEIYQDHVNYNVGLLYFLANDKRVPKDIRNEVSSWGLPRDEFGCTGHWPHHLYIREGRRMISDYIMSDKNCLQQEFVDDSVGLASFHMDSHNCRRVVIDGRVVNEGDVQVPTPPYEISYQSIRPKKAECTNLLVPVCLSASHIAYGSIRMEPVFMILGQAVGVAAVLAHKHNKTVQDVDYDALKSTLIEYGQVVNWTKNMNDDPIKRMKDTFGKV